MQLSLQTFTSLVQNMAAAVQSATSQLLDLTIGSVTRSIIEANASVGLWMQWLILQVLQSTRAATSGGADLDSWMADMTLTRLPPIAATGLVTFSRFTPIAPALIPAGALVRTADGSQIFSVTADVSNPAWTAASNGYSVPVGLATLSVPVTAQTAGKAGNVQTGAITLMATAIPGVDSVVNTAALQNGLDAESDAALRLRFQNFVLSRSRATPLAITYAVTSIQQGLDCSVLENQDAAGNLRVGNFVVTVDDGSGTPSANLLSVVSTAIEAVRPVGSSFTVQPPIVITVNPTLVITVSAGVVKGDVAVLVTDAISGYINTLPIGVGLPITKLAQLAYEASPGISNVNQILVNGAAGDITPSAMSVIKAGIVAVN